jgi:hypothetical protein
MTQLLGDNRRKLMAPASRPVLRMAAPAALVPFVVVVVAVPVAGHILVTPTFSDGVPCRLVAGGVKWRG